MLLAGVAEVFVNIRQQSNVCSDVEVVVVAQRLASERVPNFVRMLEILVRDVLSGEIAKEFFFVREVRFFEFLP